MNSLPVESPLIHGWIITIGLDTTHAVWEALEMFIYTDDIFLRK